MGRSHPLDYERHVSSMEPALACDVGRGCAHGLLLGALRLWSIGSVVQPPLIYLGGCT